MVPKWEHQRAHVVQRQLSGTSSAGQNVAKSPASRRHQQEKPQLGDRMGQAEDA